MLRRLIGTLKALPKPILWIMVFGSVFLFLFLSIEFFFYTHKKVENHKVREDKSLARLSTEEMGRLQEGDIILRRGYGFFSDMIATHFNDSHYDVTHAGILYQKENQWWVIHSLSSKVSEIEGVQEQSLEDFLYYSVPNKIMVVRLKGIQKTEQEQLVCFAQEYVVKKTPFDTKGIIHDDKSLYCTELIWHILIHKMKKVPLPKDMEMRKELFYSMKGMYHPQYFDIIINTYAQTPSVKIEN